MAPRPPRQVVDMALDPVISQLVHQARQRMAFEQKMVVLQDLARQMAGVIAPESWQFISQTIKLLLRHQLRPSGRNVDLYLPSEFKYARYSSRLRGRSSLNQGEAFPLPARANPLQSEITARSGHSGASPVSYEVSVTYLGHPIPPPLPTSEMVTTTQSGAMLVNYAGAADSGGTVAVETFLPKKMLGGSEPDITPLRKDDRTRPQRRRKKIQGCNQRLKWD